ncbi:MAG TPA: helix-hairpin-helix domain-containing protein [Bryobacteraceae bacterium]|nr:helix-hairpin-helix domain-containing protein [Bryobacteraceae bacterium]
MGRVLLLLVPVLVSTARAYDFPAGSGRDTFLRVCSQCHSADLVSGLKYSHPKWQQLVYAMAERGSSATSAELDSIVDYLAKAFPPADEPGKVNVNEADAAAIASGLALTDKEAQAIVAYRERHGDFHQWGDLLVIYGVDGKKIEAAKDRIKF